MIFSQCWRNHLQSRHCWRTETGSTEVLRINRCFEVPIAANIFKYTFPRVDFRRNFTLSLFSKKILTLGAKEDPPPHPKSVQLQRMIRYSATLFVQVRRHMFNGESDLSYAYFVMLLVAMVQGPFDYLCLPVSEIT